MSLLMTGHHNFGKVQFFAQLSKLRMFAYNHCGMFPNRKNHLPLDRYCFALDCQNRNPLREETICLELYDSTAIFICQWWKNLSRRRFTPSVVFDTEQEATFVSQFSFCNGLHGVQPHQEDIINRLSDSPALIAALACMPSAIYNFAGHIDNIRTDYIPSNGYLDSYTSARTEKCSLN